MNQKTLIKLSKKGINMKKKIVLYITSDVASYGFLMEEKKMTGLKVPPIVNFPKEKNLDRYITKLMKERFLISNTKDLHLESLGEREMSVDDPKYGMETCLATRYSITIKAKSILNMVWKDPDGFIHVYKWSGNSPY